MCTFLHFRLCFAYLLSSFLFSLISPPLLLSPLLSPLLYFIVSHRFSPLSSPRFPSIFPLASHNQRELDGNDEETEHSKVSKVNLVDLAGSERSDAAGTSGIRLRVR